MTNQSKPLALITGVGPGTSAEATLHDGEGRLCATATSTLLLFDIEPRSSRRKIP